MKNSEPKEVVSARIERELHGKIKAVSKRDNVSVSDIIADCIYRQFSSARSYTNISVSKEPRHGKLGEEDKELIEIYRRVFNYRGRIFYPAVLSTIKKRRREGMTQDDLAHCIMVAPKDDWIASRMKAKQAPPINELLSPKMAARLIQIEPELIPGEEGLDDLEQYKRAILDAIWESIPFDERDSIRDNILTANSKVEVDQIAGTYRQ